MKLILLIFQINQMIGVYAPKGIHLSIEGYSIISKKILQQIMKL